MPVWLVEQPKPQKPSTPQQQKLQTDVWEQLNRLCGEAWNQRLGHNLASTELREWWIRASNQLEEYRDLWERTFGR